MNHITYIISELRRAWRIAMAARDYAECSRIDRAIHYWLKVKQAGNN